jgi:hypothetical protein
MFGITAFATAPFASLGSTSAEVAVTGGQAQTQLGVASVVTT